MGLNIRGFIQAKKQQMQEKRIMLKEKRLVELNAEAERSRKESKLLKDEKKYRAQINETKQLRKERRAERLAPIKKFVGNVKEKIRDNAGSKSIATAPANNPFTTGRNPFYDDDSGVKKKNNIFG